MMNKDGITNSEFVIALSSIYGWGKSKVVDYVLRHALDLQECLNFLEIELNSNELSTFYSKLEFAREDLKSNDSLHIKSICLLDKSFPKKLYLCKDPVIHLFYVGDIELLNSKCITIIGTRNPTHLFIDEGYKISSYFAKNDITIVSGLALGCDSIAHQSAIDSCGKTIAILPSALNKIVPSQNILLAKSIIQNKGLIISEYSISSTMNKFNYPQRDRIQSLLSNVTIVIQSENDGGSMIAVKKSIKDGKKVFAIKGNNLELVPETVDSSSIEQLNIIKYL